MWNTENYLKYKEMDKRTNERRNKCNIEKMGGQNKRVESIQQNRKIMAHLYMSFKEDDNITLIHNSSGSNYFRLNKAFSFAVSYNLWQH